MSTYSTFLHARYVAEYLLQQATRETCDRGHSGYLDDEIAKHFAQLAEGLGYTVSPIPSEPVAAPKPLHDALFGDVSEETIRTMDAHFSGKPVVGTEDAA